MKKLDVDRCRAILRSQRESILENVTRLRKGELDLDQDDFPDEMDSAVAESNLSFAGRIQERESQLLSKIDEALEQIDRGDYGDCSSCGEEIAIKRLLARPVAGLCIECKDEQERSERQRS
ncbi:MAG: TraR/DksA C4-type zinc finger protein [Myxococcota bacterium]